MAAVQSMEEPVRMDAHRYVAPELAARAGSMKHLRDLAQRTETRKEDRRQMAIRKAREDLGSRYYVDTMIGEGGYGVVFSAVHRASRVHVAIKRVAPFEHQLLAIRTLRELRLLRFFCEQSACENVIRLLDVVIPGDRQSFQDVYLVQEMMDTDLYRVLRTQALSYDHAQYFTYQILRGLKPIHAAGVLHRDIKPSNLLVNANCDLKICDFGLARDISSAHTSTGELQLTEYVATRWYRAPEIMLSSKSYTKAVDMWSVGCTLYEMLRGEPLFPGKDYHHQMSLILDVLGTAAVEEIRTQCSQRALDYVRAMPWRQPRPWRTLLPDVREEALDFLARTVAMDPRKRMTVEEALAHPFVAPYHDPSDEPTAPALDPQMFMLQTPFAANVEVHRQALWDDSQRFARAQPQAV